ncbi:pupal cuticle protein 27-like [Cimex lectularius]|uniref:CPR type cuticle protein n=1 Tax=Cimex lectularius TaxID=79782 RepID=A0A8I6RN39_CIMLE|nr:pupal cuticle protein 27-like [Cimex lectularius]
MMHLLLLFAVVGSSLGASLRVRKQSGGTVTFFNQTFPAPPGVPQETINQFQGAFQQGSGFLPQPPSPPQGFIPQNPGEFLQQGGSGFISNFQSQLQQDELVGRNEPKPVVPIVTYQFTPNSVDGSYQFSYESGDGTKREESGSQKAVGEPAELGTVAKGSYSYTDPDGNLVQVSYTADERGFVPTGSHLPTPPPVPPEILKGLEASAANEAAQNNGVISPSYNYFFRNAYRRHY